MAVAAVLLFTIRVMNMNMNILLHVVLDDLGRVFELELLNLRVDIGLKHDELLLDRRNLCEERAALLPQISRKFRLDERLARLHAVLAHVEDPVSLLDELRSVVRDPLLNGDDLENQLVLPDQIGSDFEEEGLEAHERQAFTGAIALELDEKRFEGDSELHHQLPVPADVDRHLAGEFVLEGLDSSVELQDRVLETRRVVR